MNLLLRRFVLHAICAIMSSSAFGAPLSCEVQMMLNGLSALRRDQGEPRTKSVLLKPVNELTKQEAKEILDRVYITMKNRTPDQIKDAVYAACKARGG